METRLLTVEKMYKVHNNLCIATLILHSGKTRNIHKYAMYVYTYGYYVCAYNACYVITHCRHCLS